MPPSRNEPFHCSCSVFKCHLSISLCTVVLLLAGSQTAAAKRSRRGKGEGRRQPARTRIAHPDARTRAPTRIAGAAPPRTASTRGPCRRTRITVNVPFYLSVENHMEAINVAMNVPRILHPTRNEPLDERSLIFQHLVH